MKRIFLLSLLLAIISCSSEPYVIVQIADAQLGFTATSQCQKEKTEYNDDVTYEVECLAKAVALVNELKPDAVVFTGDQVHHPLNEIELDAFAQQAEGIADGIDVFYLPGNHDVLIGEEQVDMSPFTKRFGEGTFLSVKKGVRMVGLNSNFIKYNDPRENDQLEWLRGALKKSRKNEVSLIFCHHPFFLNEVDEADGYFQIQASKRQCYMELFESNGVDAVYAGHLHNNSAGSYNEIPVVTTTSVAYQIGGPQPSVRIIKVEDGTVSDELVPIG